MSYDAVKYEAVELRSIFSIDEYTPIDIDNIVSSQKDITFLSFPMSDNICGISKKDSNNKIIAINSNHNLGRQRFTFAHELYHLFFQKDFSFSVCVSKTKPTIEKYADVFASYFLMPQNALYKYLKDNLLKEFNEECKLDITFKNVVQIEQYFQISHLALLTRLKGEKIITESQKEEYQDGITSYAKSLGYDDKLYKKPQKTNCTTGKYLNIVEKLYNSGIINDRDREEYLLDVGIEEI